MADIAALSSTATALNGTTSKADSALSSLTDDLDNFLTILTTQLQHQDPLEPLDTHEFTNQLVQFSTVEQAIAQNKNLENLISLTQSNMAISAVSYIGKQISATGQVNQLTDGKAEYSYTLPETAKAASLSISDKNGTIVYVGKAETTEGTHSFVWDGKSTLGAELLEGAYKLTVNAVNKDSQQITPTYGITGKVTDVEFDGSNAVLGIGDVQVPLTSIKSINDAKQEES
jgi:flagellar basal-body rod modification protein FlgD